MKKILILLSFVTILIGFWACSNNDNPIDTSETVIRVDNKLQNDFDKYLEREFVEPYNLRILYKLPDFESDFSYTLSPARYRNSVRMANLIKYLCLEPYKKVAPAGFLQKHFPKFILLVGSAAYNPNGTIVLGTAEGGLKITLYRVNRLDVDDIQELYNFYFRTIYHEFSHILHQTTDYSIDFDKISASTYVGGLWVESWNSDDEARQAGFISRYGSSEANEDFVELISYYITTPQSDWDTMIQDAGDGGPIMTQKMGIIRDYLDKVWDLDIDALRDEIQLRVSQLDQQDLDNIE
ncbi:putative zinc-binding metallopeptidase [Polaribacter batillariae]|uniref:Zinc-binding metallopeptidase n=1 Tax=Polaribacter batillariae TaxID=2808900 RepID=A0ABX7SRU3_9FLAO|nr:putative zinc-binding metallopeptidase [Polaribacter batillariae]QTD36582.1 putative zinc-binding metallopeptidase [Polaribacter batillariae]